MGRNGNPIKMIYTTLVILSNEYNICRYQSQKIIIDLITRQHLLSGEKKTSARHQTTDKCKVTKTRSNCLFIYIFLADIRKTFVTL